MIVEYSNMYGDVIATSELCDLHVLLAWGERNKNLNIKEFKTILEKIPNTDKARNILDVFMENYNSDVLIKELFLQKESELYER